MNLQDILNDPKTFTDEMEMQLGEHKVRLGDIRGLSSRQQKELSDRIASASERERIALETSEKASGIFNNLKKLEEEATAAAKSRPTGDEDDFDTNNWWTPARKRLSAQEKKLDDAIARVSQLNDAFTKAATMFATDRWNSQFDRVSPKLKKSKDYADWDVSRVREYATKNNILDEFGFPSVEKAAALLTRADDIEEARRVAREEGMREGLQRARLASTARPTSATGKPATRGKSSVEELGLEGLGDDVMADDELMEQIEKAQAAFDPTSLQ